MFGQNSYFVPKDKRSNTLWESKMNFVIPVEDQERKEALVKIIKEVWTVNEYNILSPGEAIEKAKSLRGQAKRFEYFCNITLAREDEDYKFMLRPKPEKSASVVVFYPKQIGPKIILKEDYQYMASTYFHEGEGFYDINAASAKLYLQNLNYTLNLLKEEISRISNGVTITKLRNFYEKNAVDLPHKTLIISDKYLHSGFSNRDMKVYPYPYRFVGEEEYIQLLNEDSDDYVFLIVGGQSSTKGWLPYLSLIEGKTGRCMMFVVKSALYGKREKSILLKKSAIERIVEHTKNAKRKNK